MFKKAQRLTKKQFDAAFQSGKRNHFPNCTIVTAPSPTRHVSVVVGKKVAKSAVKRNTLRRRVYAQVRSALAGEDSTGVYIILLKSSFATLPRKMANEAVRAAVARLNKSE